MAIWNVKKIYADSHDHLKCSEWFQSFQHDHVSVSMAYISVTSVAMNDLMLSFSNITAITFLSPIDVLLINQKTFSIKNHVVPINFIKGLMNFRDGSQVCEK